MLSNKLSKTDKILDKQQKETEKQLIRNYKLALKDIKSKIGKLYEQTNGSFADAQRYNRLEKLEKQIAIEIGKLTGKNASLMSAGLRGLYKESFYRSAFAIEQAAGEMGYSIGFNMLNPKVIEKAIENPLDRVGFLKRNRENQARLTRQLQENLTQGLIQGKSYQQTAKVVSERMGIGAYNANRIVQTESHRIQQGARNDVLGEADKLGVVMKKTWVSSLDSNTRDAHQSADGQTKNVDEPFIVNGESLDYPGDSAGSGSNVINCRCSHSAIIEGYEPKVRKARDDNGKSVLVQNQTYKEWKASKTN